MTKKGKSFIEKNLQHVRYLIKKKSLFIKREGWDPLKIHHIPPNDVVYVTPVTPFTDSNRHESHGVYHPHSAINRGEFKKSRIGRVFSKDWDLKLIFFDNLIEFTSIKDFLNGTEKWENTPFAQRTIAWIEAGNKYREFTNVDEYLVHQPKRILNLAKSIENKGLNRVSHSRYDRTIFDEITINIGRDGDIFFNNRGHHRLSIAKIVGCNEIPVLVNTRHNINNKLCKLPHFLDHLKVESFG